MTFRLRAWLASLAVCFVPSMTHAQQFYHQCSTAPVALEARLSLTQHSWDPSALITALSPAGEISVIATTATEPTADTEDAEGPPVADSRNDVPKSIAATPAPATHHATAPSDRNRDAAEEAALADLIGVDHCVPEALRARIALAQNLARLGSEEPVDVADVAQTGPARRTADEQFTVMMPTFRCVDAGFQSDNDAHLDRDPATVRSSDSAVIVTLTPREEYVPYDLTAADRLAARMTPFGIPRFDGPLPRAGTPVGVLKPNGDVPGIDIARDIEKLRAAVEWFATAFRKAASPATAEPVVGEAAADHWAAVVHERVVSEPVAALCDEAAVDHWATVLQEERAFAKPTVTDAPDRVAERVGTPPTLPIDCLLDEIVWQATTKLQPGSRLRRVLQPERIGGNLARLMGTADRRADHWIDAVATWIPASPAPAPAFTAPVVVSATNSPSVCCPLECIAEHAEPESPEPSVTAEADAPAVDPSLQIVLQQWQKVQEVVQSLSARWNERIAAQPKESEIR